MRKLITLLFLATFSLSIYAQQNDIPNWNFEKWDTVSSFSPHNWTLTMGKVTRVNPAHSGSWACRIASDPIQQSPGVLLDGYTSNGMTFWGGQPFSQRPDSIHIFMKYNIVPNDSAVMVIMFKKNGSYITSSFPPIPIAWGTDTSSFKDHKFKINYLTSDTPDSVIFGIVSSDYVVQQSFSPQNFIIVDDITFSGTGITQHLPNYGFEKWDTTSTINVENWYISTGHTPGLPAAISISTDHSAGNYAAKIQSIITSSDTVRGVTFTPSQGSQPWDNKPAFALTQPFSCNNFSFDYKFNPLNNDSILINIGLYKNGSGIGGGSFRSGDAVNNWTTQNVSIGYDPLNPPDSAKIFIFAYNCNSKCNPLGNSTLYIDNLQFGTITDIKPQLSLSNDFFIYPNPFSSTSTLSYMLSSTENVKIELFDVLGNRVSTLMNETKSEGSYNLTINAIDLQKGIYFCRIQMGSNSEIKKFVVIK